MKPSRNRTVLAAVASVAALAAGLVGPTTAAASAAPDAGPAASSPRLSGPVEYVAMGDSYSAASGVLPLDPAAPPNCLRSTRNYPHVIADAAGFRLTDVTCGGADTTHYRDAQYPNQPAQLDALSRRTRLVTMTIGGNDSNVFISSILACGALGASTLGQGSPCKDRFGSQFTDTIRQTTFPSIVRALRDVRRRAPRARIAILGYPWIMPRRGGCFDKMPVAKGDVPYLRGLQWVLNDAVRRAARRTGATYVNMNKVSDGHDACQPIGTRWVEPVTQGTNPVIVHPNALGEARMARQALRTLGVPARVTDPTLP